MKEKWSPTMEIANEILNDLPLFSGIEKNDMQAMLHCIGAFIKDYEKEDYLSFETDHVKSVGIVLNGSVDMVKEDIWGNRSIIARMQRGQLLGESFACGTNTRSNVAFQASQKSRVIFLPFERVMHTCTTSCAFHHRLIENMVIMIADKNRSLMEKIEVVAKKSLREKILSYLSLEAEKQGTKYIELPMGRVELADYLSTDRSALTRELSKMRDEGILDYEKNTFQIRNM